MHMLPRIYAMRDFICFGSVELQRSRSKFIQKKIDNYWAQRNSNPCMARPRYQHIKM